MKKAFHLVTLCTLLGAAATARATPSTMVWAPSTAAFQGYLVPHLTYDTYVANNAGYAVDTGLTMGVLPLEKLNAEVGFDVMLPSTAMANNPLLFNAKIGTPEGAFGDWVPGLAVGMFGIGTKSDVTNYDILYAQVGKTIPGLGGYASVGGYAGLGPDLLFAGSDGSTNKYGFIGGITAPDLNVNASWLKKIVFAADIQTGKNAFGATGLGASFYFSDNVSLLTGPIFFLDPDIQPNRSSMMWTFQLDVDMPLRASSSAAAPAPAPVMPKI